MLILLFCILDIYLIEKMINFSISNNKAKISPCSVFFCKPNFQFNSKSDIYGVKFKNFEKILMKKKEEDYFVFNVFQIEPKKIIFINQKKIICLLIFKA